MKKRITRIICLLITAAMALIVATGCEKTPEPAREPDKLAAELSASLKTSLNSQEFSEAVQSARSARERTELM